MSSQLSSICQKPTLLNHGLAVATGRLLTAVIPLDAISLAAALSFILFGLWTIRGDRLEGEDRRVSPYGPFLTVAVAFFLAELGDKTQLTTISLAVQYDSPAQVLLGTTSGMVVADGFGIIVGSVLGRRLPEAVIRLASAAIFILFGLVGSGHILGRHLPLAASAALLFVLTVGTLGAVHSLLLRAGGPAERSRGFRRLPQGAYGALLLLAYLAGLGLFRGLAAVDHWVAALLLGLVGWRSIHDGAGRGAAGRGPGLGLPYGVLALLLASAVQAACTGFRLATMAVPLLLLAAALALMLCPGALARRWLCRGRLAALWARRVEVASGLVLFGIAVKTLLDHLA